MGFIMDGLDAEGYDRSYSDRQLLSRIFDYFRPHVATMGFVALMIVLDSLMSAVLPILIARGLDTIAIDGSAQRTGLLIAAILASGALAWTFNFFRQWYTARTVGDVVLELREDAFDAVVGVNLKGSYFSAQAAARQMVAQGGGGRIILTSSVTGNKAVRNLSAYAMTKGGLQMLARNLVLELSPHGITINAVAPGAIVTERNLRDDPEYAEHWAAVVPLGRAGQPMDIAPVALFLASDEASYITGAAYIIDGGRGAS